MKLVIQRVLNASVEIGGQVFSAISHGLMVLVGIHEDDNGADTDKLIKKLLQLRIFNDANGKMNLSLLDVKGDLLLVSQFTLYANCDKGHRPSYIQAAKPEKAKEMYNVFVNRCKEALGEDKVKTGVFGADMKVALVNDGPVTIIL